GPRPDRARDVHRSAHRARLGAHHRAAAPRPLVRRRGRRDRPATRRRDGRALGGFRRHPRPRRRGRAAHPLLLPLGALRGPGRRGAGRGQLDPGRVHAAARGRRHTAARRRERLRLPRHLGRAARPQPRGEHRGLAARDRRAARVRGAGRGL
ncbi:MAG: hypothetical protein AVDCRST_MAG13-3921, partial [uncultured Solirubrobacteraceae bacterium]